MSRTATIERSTNETSIELSVDLDGGAVEAATGVGFFDHMLDLLGRHGRLGLHVEARGDLQTGSHHTVEDVGIALGQALDRALGDRAGIRRYGHALVPMDEALARCVIDLSGRPFTRWEVPLPPVSIANYEVELHRGVLPRGGDEREADDCIWSRRTARIRTTSSRPASRPSRGRCATPLRSIRARAACRRRRAP